LTNLQAVAAPSYLLGFVFLREETNLVSFGSDHIARVWDFPAWRELRSWHFSPGTVTFEFNPGARLVASGTSEGLVEIIDVLDPSRRRQFNCQPRLVTVDVSPDARTLVAASENGTVEVWDIPAERRTALLGGVLLGFHSSAISPDGRRIGAGSNGLEAVKLWDMESHEEVATLAGQGSFFSLLRFSPDGNTIAARNWNGVLHFWKAPSWAVIEAEEQAAGEGSR
jgi:WD40 repeat protein